MKKKSYVNRYGDEIRILEIKEIGNSDFIMSNINMDFMRISFNEKDEVIMFDPPGGPYVTAEHGNQPGLDMGWFDPKWEYHIIEKIELNYSEKTAKLKCKYTKPIEWKVVKN